jgi:3-keto-disaccharide hydrolase
MALKPDTLHFASSSRMYRVLELGCSCLLALTVSSVSSGAPLSLSWNFDADAPNTLPRDFEVGTLFDGRAAGEWRVVQTEKANSAPHVLGQLQGKGAEHAYKVVLIKGTQSSDFDLSVSFLPIAGKADMGGGLIWRAADDRNYYLVRANPLEQNLRIFRVVKGVRHMLENFDQIVDVTKWHTLHVVAKECRLQVFYDNKPVFDICDRTFSRGRIGLWTKSDAVSYFDDLHLQIVD